MHKVHIYFLFLFFSRVGDWLDGDEPVVGMDSSVAVDTGTFASLKRDHRTTVDTGKSVNAGTYCTMPVPGKANVQQHTERFFTQPE